MSSEVAERIEQDQAPVVHDESAALISIISRAASDPHVDMDKMERLLQMQERIVARNSELAFNEAMKDAQKEMGRISADANNSQTRSKYATYGKLDSVLRPIYTRHGFALSFSTDVAAADGYVRVVCHMSHDAGHTRLYHVDMPADGKGAKGGDVMTKTHATGAAMSYGMRYLLKMIFNVAIGEDDNDGNGEAELINLEQLEQLRSLITEVSADLPKFCAYFKIEALPDLPAARFSEAIRTLENKRVRK